ncbi:MAG: FAD-dependent oxidoreductase, partial [Gammaproteobacteria bacterium]|nr:FAD-dependent oxidoreductase [Gammaproteobacteria bacterium]
MSEPVIIVGGGWAGLSAAMELSQHGIPVHLLESAPQLGGRARTAPFAQHQVDNGQHLLLGAYHHTLRILSLTGVDEHEAFVRQPLTMLVHNQQQPVLLNTIRLPAPLHILAALARAKGLGLKDKLAALRLMLQMAISGFSIR